MKEIKKELLKLVGRAIEVETDIEVYSWPPHCASIFHQPKRPVEKTEDANCNQIKIW